MSQTNVEKASAQMAALIGTVGAYAAEQTAAIEVGTPEVQQTMNRIADLMNVLGAAQVTIGLLVAAADADAAAGA